MAAHDRRAPKRRGVTPGEFWSGLILEELARMQNVRPVERLEEVVGGWPRKNFRTASRRNSLSGDRRQEQG
jgi:hypothetical protein